MADFAVGGNRFAPERRRAPTRYVEDGGTPESKNWGAPMSCLPEPSSSSRLPAGDPPRSGRSAPSAVAAAAAAASSSSHSDGRGALGGAQPASSSSVGVARRPSDADIAGLGDVGLESTPEPRATRPRNSSGESSILSSGEDHQMWAKPCYFIARHAEACVSVGCMVVLSIVCIGLFGLSLEVDTSFDAFLMTDVDSSLKFYAYEFATESKNSYSRRLEEELSDTRRLSDEDDGTVYMSKDLFVYYELKPEALALNEGVFHSKAIFEISNFERRLLGLPKWRELCYRTSNVSQDFCNPGLSIVRYKLPTLKSDVDQKSIVPSAIELDGKGFDPVSTAVSLELMEQHGMVKALLPEDYNHTVYEDGVPLQIIRSAFRFRIPCCSISDPVGKREEWQSAFTEEWEHFFLNDMLPLLSEDREEQLLQIWYGGSDIEAIEVKNALSGDMKLAIMSLLYVHFYLLVHTRSVLLSICGPLIALMAVPVTFVLNAMVSGTTTLSFANFLALFLIVGFGADVIFVYTDFWFDSQKHRATLEARLTWTYKNAAKSSATTTFTTALAFGANLFSVIRVLRQFGFFMGLCVVIAWVLVSCIYAPLLVVSAKYNMHCKRCPRRQSTDRGLMARWMRKIFYRRRCFAFMGVLTTLLAVVLTIPNASMATEAPSIFPKEHNQNKGARIRDQFNPEDGAFKSMVTPPPREETVCASEGTRADSDCAVHWCEAEQRSSGSFSPFSNETRCQCFEREFLGTCPGEAKGQVLHRFVGVGDLGPHLADQVVDYVDNALAVRDYRDKSAVRLGRLATGPQPYLLQEWEAGTVAMMTAVEARSIFDRTESEACGYMELCFCGELRCQLDSEWQRLPEVTFSHVRRLDSSRVLPVSSRTKVRVLFGIGVETEVALLDKADPADTWHFLERFDMSQPWTQRNIYKFCMDLRTPAASALQVTREWCWMVGLRNYLNDKGQRFPSRPSEFKEYAQNFIASGSSSTPGERYIWTIGGQVQAMYVSVETNFHKSDEKEKVLEYKEVWDQHLDLYNAEAFKEARGAFHVSSVWVDAERAGQLITSTLETLATLFILAFLAMILFTRSCHLSFYVVLSTMAVMCGLAFFIVVVNGWDVGLVEVIAIIYFIGYALDYSLHIAYKYSNSEATMHAPSVDTGKEKLNIRLQRTEFAVRSMGGAVLGSALTTAGAAFFLLFANLTLFRRLGAMCLIVTTLSIIVALGPLPAALIWSGPAYPGTWGSCIADLAGAVRMLRRDNNAQGASFRE